MILEFMNKKKRDKVFNNLKISSIYQTVAAVKTRVDRTFIPDDWIASTFLKKCFERKGVKEEGFIKSYHENFARFGKKKVSK